jgi:hypothetical protein
MLDFCKQDYGDFLAHVVTAPLLQISLRCQLDPSRSVYSQCNKNVLRVPPFNIIYYFPVKGVKKVLAKYDDALGLNKNTWKSIVLRAGSETLAYSLIYPLSNIETRLYAESNYCGLVECVRSVWEKQGILGFYTGFWYSVLGKLGYGLLSELLAHATGYRKGSSYLSYTLVYPIKVLKERSIVEGMRIDGRTYKTQFSKLSWTDLWAGLPIQLFSIFLIDTIPHLYQ